MNLTSWLLIATLFYAVMNLLIGFWKTRADTFESFVSYRDKAGLIFVVLSLNATFIGGGMFFATGEMGYEAGLTPIVLPICTALGLLIVYLLSSRIRRLCREKNALTLYDYIDVRLQQDDPWKPRFVASFALINMSLYFFLLAGQFLVLTTFLEAFTDLPGNVALTASVAVVFVNTLVYGVVGGLKKDIWTDAFQMAMIFLGMTVIGIHLLSAQNLKALESLPPPTDPGAYGPLFIIGSLLFFTPAFLVRYDIWQRVLAAKDDRTVLRAVGISIPIVLFSYLLFIVCGNFARSLSAVSDDGRFAVVNTIEALLGSRSFIIVTIALFAAVMSSADTFLNITSVSLHRLVTGVSDEKGSRRNLLQVRVLAFAICVASALLIVLSPDVVDLMVGAFSSLVIMAPALVYVIFANAPKARPAFFSVIFGFGIFLTLFFGVSALQKTAFTIATTCSVIILLIFRSVRKSAGAAS